MGRLRCGSLAEPSSLAPFPLAFCISTGPTYLHASTSMEPIKRELTLGGHCQPPVHSPSLPLLFFCSLVALHCSVCRASSWLGEVSNQQLAMARGSGAVVLAAAVLLCVLLHAHVAESAVFTVGDSGGWSFNTNTWTNGKRFKAGDVLVFKYDSTAHNVVAVNAAGYSGCSAPRGARVYKSGNDRVTLARGTNYFICSIPGHCQSGMKIAATAA